MAECKICNREILLPGTQDSDINVYRGCNCWRNISVINLKDKINAYEYDTTAHVEGRCSFPLLSICSALEQHIKLEMLKIVDSCKGE